MEKYKRIYKELYYRIKSGDIPAGTVLPTEAQLAAQYGVSKITAKTALNLLKADGLVLRKKRLGTVVLNGIVNFSGDKLIAIVFSGFDHLDIRFTNSLTQVAKSKNVKLAFFDSKISSEKEREILLYLISENIAGLILMPLSQGGNLDVISLFAIQKIPVVYMDFPSHALFAPTVTSDNFGGMYMMVKYLIDCGHRSIGFFPYSDHFYPTENDRFEGYCRALIDNGIPIGNDFLFSASAISTYSLMSSVSTADMNVAEEFFDSYLKLNPKPTALVCVNDLSAHAVIAAAKERGVRVPEDLSVTGFDNLTVSAKREITTVAQNFAEIAKTALLTLIRKIDGVNNEPPVIRLHTVLIKRDSVQKLALPDQAG